jgi:hypothetical protein
MQCHSRTAQLVVGMHCTHHLHAQQLATHHTQSLHLPACTSLREHARCIKPLMCSAKDLLSKAALTHSMHQRGSICITKREAGRGVFYLLFLLAYALTVPITFLTQHVHQHSGAAQHSLQQMED